MLDLTVHLGKLPVYPIFDLMVILLLLFAVVIENLQHYASKSQSQQRAYQEMMFYGSLLFQSRVLALNVYLLFRISLPQMRAEKGLVNTDT